MFRPYCLVALSLILLAGLLTACGTAEEFRSSDPAPSRADLIARLQSPAEAKELHSFRIRTETSFSGSLFAIGDSSEPGTGTMSMQADVTTDPPAIHLTTRIVEDGSEDGSEVDEMIVLEDALWRSRGDGWHEEEMFLPDLTQWLLESFTELRNPIASGSESPETADMLQGAEIVGHEDVDGHRTTQFRMTTDQVLALMMADYQESIDGGQIQECENLEALDADDVTEDPDTGALMDAIDCWGAAIRSEMPPPDEYIERFEVDIWVSDEGFVMRETTVMAYSFVPFFDFDDEHDSGEHTPVTMTMSFELYDLNADFEIAPPSVE